MKAIVVIVIAFYILVVGSVLAADRNVRVGKRFIFQPKSLAGGKIPKFISSSSEESNAPRPILSARGHDCGRGAAQKFPVEKDQCYAIDENERRSARGACEYYVECDSDLCRWLKRRCEAGKFWNEHREKCVPRLEADCAPSMFGKTAKLMIENYRYETYLSECQNCPDSENFSGPTSVVGLRGNPEKPKWYQTLVAKQREHNPYYSLAFDRVHGDDFKVIDGYLVSGVPMSRLYDEDKWEGTGWSFVPVPSEEEEVSYLIVCKTSGKALEMTGDVDENNNYKIKLAQPDLDNKAQMWTVHHLENRVRKTGDNYKAYSSFSGSSSSFSNYNLSEENFRVAGLRFSKNRLRADAQCPSGGSSYDPTMNKYPEEDEECFSEDLNHKEAYPEDCQQFLHCDPFECLWRLDECDAAHYWNNIKGQCVQSLDATCGGALFGKEAVVQIENFVYKAILDDCRSCGGKEWQDQTPVIGFKDNGRQEWNQVLVARRRGDSNYYSLAFNRGEGNKVKVVTDLGDDKVASKMFNIARPEQAQWRFVPIPGRRNRIRIMSVYSGKALTMGRIEGEKEFKVRVAKLDTDNKKQEWIVNGLEGSPLPF